MDDKPVPDLIAPAVAAYYHVPAVWCHEAPTDEEWQNAPEGELIKNVFEKTICDCIKVRVRRDGLFVFDFSQWTEASETEIPGYDRKTGGKIPRQVTEAELIGEKKAYYRILVFNVHQACISSAHSAVHSRSTGLGHLVTPTRLITLVRFETNAKGNFYLSNDPFQRYLVTQTTLTPPFRLSHPEIRQRNLLELDTISYSFDLLEKIMQNEFSELPLLIEMLYRAARQWSECHFADCLILCWTVCERLLNATWDNYLSERMVDKDSKVRINGKRQEKLTGRDFTASIISESLELASYLPTDLFKDIDSMRKARNDRLHNLGDTTDNEASQAVRTSQNFLEYVTGIKISLGLSRVVPGTGGIPKHLLYGRT